MQQPIPRAEPFDSAANRVGLNRSTGAACFMVQDAPGPPERLDGFTIGVGVWGGPSPHNGEMHPDGDELLYVIDGVMHVLLELDDGDRTIDVPAGQAIVIPKGTWHRGLEGEPSRVLNITPGPAGRYRPLDETPS